MKKKIPKKLYFKPSKITSFWYPLEDLAKYGYQPVLGGSLILFQAFFFNFRN
jgi:hypothetical protein